MIIFFNVIYPYHIYLPNTVENVAVREDTNVKIWREDGVKPADLLISEESVRHPHLAGVRHGQVFYFACTSTWHIHFVKCYKQ